MADNSPLEFAPPTPKAAKLSKKPFILVLTALGLMLGVFSYSFISDEKAEEHTPAPIDTSFDKPLVTMDGVSGLLTPSAPPALAEEKIQDIPSITVINLPKDENAEMLRREREIIRQRLIQAHVRALESPIGVQKSDRGNAAGNAAAYSGSPGGSSGRPSDLRMPDFSGLRPDSYDPAADRDKEEFFTRSATVDQEWLSTNKVMEGQPLEVKTGTIIPGAMITGINSDLPGAIIAQVSQNVYDTANGNYLLIPQGAKLYGAYDSRVVYGQSRVLVAWNRIIFPDGRALTLGAMPGADMSGYGGYEDEIDNHYLRIFGSAILMSLFTGGVAYTLDTVDTSRNDDDSPSVQNEMTAALASQLGQTTATLLQKNLSIKPTLEIRPGFRFNVIVTKDLAFNAPYGARQ
jgi:type IV secretion system protein VirB10